MRRGNSLDNSRREDLALIAAQFWLLAMSSFGVRPATLLVTVFISVTANISRTDPLQFYPTHASTIVVTTKRCLT